MPHAAPIALDPWPSSRWKSDLRRRLVGWYAEHARDLPWRRNRDPYCVWVSEIMLQQTTVAAVRGYFERFMTRLPTIEALAAADEHEVMKLWAGLGYYRRARQLHKAAKQIVAEHAGQFPTQLDDVRKLPGIGRYTAGAIVSIAFDTPAPILEANTVRLLSRLLLLRGDVAASENQRRLWQAAEALLPRHGAGQFNQALMELGNQVCRPRDPLCLVCPLSALCPTRAEGLQNLIPAPKARPTMVDTEEAAIAARRGGRVLLILRPAGERWAGLWDFPRFEAPQLRHQQDEAALAEQFAAATGVHIDELKPLTTLRHGVTRFRITLRCYTANVQRVGRQNGGYPERQWVRPSRLAEYALSSPARKIARLLAAVHDAT